MNYIISGPGRVGGHLVEGIIRASGIESVCRTHDPLLSLDDDLNTTLLILDRRDRFAAMMSNSIVRETDQTTEYPNKDITPFKLNAGMFRWEYVQYIDYYRKHDLSRVYAAVHKIYLEDFVNDHNRIRQLLNLSDIRVEKGTLAWKMMHNAAPYNYKDVITNWSQLQTLYLRMQQGSDVSDWN
jgi:hypothetical protein